MLPIVPETLFWLPAPPDSFRMLVKGLTGPVESARWRDLATHALDLNQLMQLHNAMARLGVVSGGALSPVRLALLSDATTDYIAPAITASGLRHGIHFELWRPPFGQSTAALLDPASGLADFAPDVVLLALEARALGLASNSMDGDGVAAALEQTRRMLARVRALGAQPLVATVAPPADSWCGHLDRRLGGSAVGQAEAFNTGLVALAEADGAILLDVAALAGRVGLARWHDPAQWNSAKLPFALDMVPLYADHVARILGSMRGKARKCLVLDLDNTLWGGVIGDDGLEGIVLGQGSAKGESFLAIQRMALELKARGVILAVCSKNEEDAARLPFQQHSEMLLKESDIAVFVANWTDKATNLTRIAAMLNIGVDALLLLDDNPAERARVRQMLPEVAVPELPEDPALYPAAVAQGGWFEAVALSADDGKRAEQYRANAERAAAMEALGDIAAYHLSLEMKCEIRPFDKVGRARIAQLINKSNQYNLATKRYTEAEVAAVEEDPARLGLQIRLIDRFGDNGMISVVIFDKGSENWQCDTWLMSCRVLGRRVEEAALVAVARAAKASGARRLLGSYVPSAKNRMVADHYLRLGFEPAGTAPDGITHWVLEVESWREPDLPMEVLWPDS